MFQACFTFLMTGSMPLRLPLSLIVAHTSKRGIGKDGALPWKGLPEDMKRFKEVTERVSCQGRQNVVLMGRRTWESIPKKYRPLQNRINVVISQTTSQKDYPEEVMLYSSFEMALEALHQPEKALQIERIFVIGGASLFSLCLEHPSCNHIYVTRLACDHWDCDVFFPNLEETGGAWEPSAMTKTKRNGEITYDFVEYKRVLPSSAAELTSGKAATGSAAASPSASPSCPGTPLRSPLNLEHEEYQYLRLISEVVQDGMKYEDRTGTGTLAVFGRQMRFNLSESFPLLTTKRVYWKGIVEELLWFIKGDTNSTHLAEKNVHIWDANGSKEFLEKRGLGGREEGDLGPVYGFQWRHFGAQYSDCKKDYSGEGVDQLAEVVRLLKTDPNNRRIVLTAWNPKDLPLMALPPCHMFCQFFVSADGALSSALYQRSCDMGLGVPFNIASYALLTCMLAQVCGLKRGEFVHFLGNTHVYSNHVDPLREQLKRSPRPFPLLILDEKVKNIDDFQSEDIKLVGYNPMKKIEMPFSA